MTRRAPAVLRAELVGVERLRAMMRLLYEATSDRRIFHAAVYEYAVADLRAAHLEAELRQAEQHQVAA